MKPHESKERKHLIVNTPCLLYTPRLKGTGERLRLLLNDEDWVVANRYRGTFRARELSPIRTQANATESRARLVVCSAGATPLQRRFNARILQVGTINSHKRRRKSKWRSSITLSGKSISTLDPRGRRPSRRKPFSKTGIRRRPSLM